jgi:predicted PurR-regulated permease PerM
MTPDRSPHTAALLATALLLLAALGYAIAPVLSPFVLLAGLLYLLAPFRGEPVPRRLLGLGILLTAVWFAATLAGILAPFLVALLLAYILNPIVTALERRKVPRWASALGVVVLFLGIVTTAALFLIPAAIGQFESLLAGAAQIAGDAVAWLRSDALLAAFERAGLPAERFRATLTDQIAPRLQTLFTGLLEGIFGLVTSLSALALQIINIIIIPFLVFYLLMDFPHLTRELLVLVPPASRDRVSQVAGRVDGILGRYFRGAVIVAVIQGTISGTVLWIAGVDYALVLGIMTGVLNFIPYLGLVVSLIVASLVATISGGAVATKVIVVVVLYLSQKLLEATVLGPRIIGGQVGLHPVLLILCLLVFGALFGFVGLLIAVPVTALIVVFVREWRERRDGIAEEGDR